VKKTPAEGRAKKTPVGVE